MGNIRLFHDIQKDEGRRVTAENGIIEELEMSPLRQAAGAPFIFFIADERRHLGYFFKNTVQLCGRG